MKKTMYCILLLLASIACNILGISITPTPIPTYPQSLTYTPQPTALPPTYTAFPTSESTQGLEGQVIADLTSICDLAEPELSPAQLTFAAGSSRTITGCATLNDELPLENTMALVVHFSSAGSDGVVMKVPWPSDIIIHADGDTKSAYALYFPWAAPLGGGWATKGSGEVTIESNAAVELLYLMPKFTGTVTIEIVNVGSFNIEIPSSP
jgi:hypothetical protein